MRKVDEWKGKTDDTAIPTRVKRRIIERDKGQCTICFRTYDIKLQPVFDHRLAICLGGANAERNLFSLCVPCHARKTKGDVQERRRLDKTENKRLKLDNKPSKWRGWRKLNGEVVFNPKFRKP